MVVLIRMAFFLLAGTVSSCAVTTSLPDNDFALVLGRLVLSSRAFTLLASALGFQLPLRLHLLLHTLVVGRIMTLTPAKCASPYFQHPDVRQVLRRCGKWAVRGTHTQHSWTLQTCNPPPTLPCTPSSHDSELLFS